MAYTPKHDYRAKDALPSGNSAKVVRGTELMEEFEAIAAATESAGFAASVKFNGSTIMYEDNVASVQCPAPNRPGQFGTCRVTFKDLIPSFDMHYAVIIQPYATNGRHVVMSVTDQRSDWIEFVITAYTGSRWESPSSPTGFSLVAVDMQQGG